MNSASHDHDPRMPRWLLALWIAGILGLVAYVVTNL